MNNSPSGSDFDGQVGTRVRRKDGSRDLLLLGRSHSLRWERSQFPSLVPSPSFVPTFDLLVAVEAGLELVERLVVVFFGADPWIPARILRLQTRIADSVCPHRSMPVGWNLLPLNWSTIA